MPFNFNTFEFSESLMDLTPWVPRLRRGISESLMRIWAFEEFTSTSWSLERGSILHKQFVFCILTPLVARPVSLNSLKAERLIYPSSATVTSSFVPSLMILPTAYGAPSG